MDEEELTLLQHGVAGLHFLELVVLLSQRRAHVVVEEGLGVEHLR